MSGVIDFIETRPGIWKPVPEAETVFMGFDPGKERDFAVMTVVVRDEVLRTFHVHASMTWGHQ